MKNYWYEQIKENSKNDIIIAIVAGKCDLTDDEEVNEEEARAFAKEIGAIFKATSAKENVGITELFRIIGYRLLDPNFNIEEPKKQITEEYIKKMKDSFLPKVNKKPKEKPFQIVIKKEESCFQKFMKKFC